jgi:lysylphosphatidylglycerol synthetase-like protein (DUF2156 family)
MTEFQEPESRDMTRWRALPGCQRLPQAMWLICGGLIGLALIATTRSGFRVRLPDARIAMDTVLGLAFVVVIAALIAVIIYIRLVTALAAAVREARSFGDLPSARLL